MFNKEVLKVIVSSFAEVIDIESFESLLSSKKNIYVKVGFDPTSGDLHLGHLVIILKLAQLQKIGMKIVIIIGDFTAMIGDPSGKNYSRRALSKSEVLSNYKTYINQIFNFLDPILTSVYFNSSWYENFLADNFIRLTSLTTVSKMLERNDFKNRFNYAIPINISEFIYPLLQSYDSIFLDIDIEIGGIDQKFNLLICREIQKKFFQKPQICMMTPLLLGIDGKNKMSKSLNNCINLTDNFYDIFCKVMSIPDSLIEDYYMCLGIVSLNEYADLCKVNSNLMDLKRFLAFKIVSLIYDSNLAFLAECRFSDFFSKRNIFIDIDPIFLNLDSNKAFLFDVLFKINFILSKSDFKRLLNSGSIEVNNEVICDKTFALDFNCFHYLKVGKKKLAKIFLKKM